MYYTNEFGNSYPAVKRERKVDGKSVTTWGRDISGCNMLHVEAGTNGYQGGDWGHGSRVFLRIEDLGGTDFCNEYDGKPLDDRLSEIVIAMGGDSELSSIKEALRWMISVLEAQTE